RLSTRRGDGRDDPACPGSGGGDADAGLAPIRRGDPMNRWLRGARGGSWSDRMLWTWMAIVFVFLFAPIVTTVLYAFNRGLLGRQTSTFTGFTTEWFSAAWTNSELRSAL